jgi:putative transposase
MGIMREACAGFETELAEFNGESSHVHLLVNFPPKIALSRLVNSLKGVSSRRMRQEFPDLQRHYWRANRLWPGSYFAGSAGGAPISAHTPVHRAAEPARLTTAGVRPLSPPA